MAHCWPWRPWPWAGSLGKSGQNHQINPTFSAQFTAEVQNRKRVPALVNTLFCAHLIMCKLSKLPEAWAKWAWAAREISKPLQLLSAQIRHPAQVRALFLRTTHLRGKRWHLEPLMKLDSQSATTTRKELANQKSLRCRGIWLRICKHGLAITLFMGSKESETENLCWIQDKRAPKSLARASTKPAPTNPPQVTINLKSQSSSQNSQKNNYQGQESTEITIHRSKPRKTSNTGIPNIKYTERLIYIIPNMFKAIKELKDMTQHSRLRWPTEYTHQIQFHFRAQTIL